MQRICEYADLQISMLPIYIYIYIYMFMHPIEYWPMESKRVVEQEPFKSVNFLPIEFLHILPIDHLQQAHSISN